MGERRGRGKSGNVNRRFMGTANGVGVDWGGNGKSGEATITEQ